MVHCSGSEVSFITNKLKVPVGFPWDQWILQTLSSARLHVHSVLARSDRPEASYLDQISTFVEFNGRMLAFLPRCLHSLEMT